MDVGLNLDSTLQERESFITIVLTIGVIAFGIHCFRQLKVEAYPDISDT